MGGPGYKFADEPVTRDYLPGTLAMANAGPNTNGSQFFIMHGKLDLPKSYNIFGMVTEGLDVVDAIADTPVGRSAIGRAIQAVGRGLHHQRVHPGNGRVDQETGLTPISPPIT